jgi:hypothetical protein
MRRIAMRAGQGQAGEASGCIVTKSPAERRLGLLSCLRQTRLLGWRQDVERLGCRSAKPSMIVSTRRPIAHVLVVTKNTKLKPQSCLLLRSYRVGGAFLPTCVRVPRGDGGRV